MDILVIIIILLGSIAISMFIFYLLLKKRYKEDKENIELPDVENDDILESEAIIENKDNKIDEMFSDITEDDYVKENPNPYILNSFDNDIEIVKVLLDNDMITFDANNHSLRNGEYIKVLYNDEYVDAVVIKENTIVQKSSLDKEPLKLILKDNDNEQEMSEKPKKPNIDDYLFHREEKVNDDIDYLPIKKKNL